MHPIAAADAESWNHGRQVKFEESEAKPYCRRNTWEPSTKEIKSSQSKQKSTPRSIGRLMPAIYVVHLAILMGTTIMKRLQRCWHKERSGQREMRYAISPTTVMSLCNAGRQHRNSVAVTIMPWLLTWLVDQYKDFSRRTKNLNAKLI